MEINISIWSTYLGSLIEFLEGLYCPRQGIFQIFCKFLMNPFSYAL